MTMTIRLNIVARDGSGRQLEAPATGSLMEVLRELDDGVAAICGGMCSCATCHVYISPEWQGRLPAQHGDERDLVSELQHYREGSRLSCQVELSACLDGLRLTLAPEE